MGYKYATVTQKTAGGNAATEKTAYYDEKYFTQILYTSIYGWVQLASLGRPWSTPGTFKQL